jgi:phospholipid-transporting ATPase
MYFFILTQNRYKLDQMANKKPAQVVRGGVLTTVDSMDICPGDIVYVQKGEKFPVDCVLLASSYDEGTVFVETAELDGETNLKRRTTCGMKVNADSYNFFAELQGQIECELPNEHLNSFVGRMNVSHPPESAKDFPLSLNNLALRGCVLRNTDWVYALVVYTGADTKIIRNLKPAVFKFSSLQKNLNTTVLCIFIYNAAILIASIVLEYQFYSNAVAVEAQNKINSTDYARDWYLGPRSTDKGIHIVKTLLSFFAMYTYVVPISLFVTMELVRLGQATYMSRDQKMLAKLRSSDGTETELPMRASNSNLNEDLGRVKFIFSDKTGTFTQNLMRMSKWYVGGLILSELDTPGILHDHMSNSAQSDVLRHFALAISLCHGVIPSLDEKTGKLIYESQSPDETALLEAVSANQYSLKKRTKDIMTVEIDGVPKDFEVMNVIEFDSTRKRMSVIVKYDGKIRLYSKGADNIMFERLDKSAKENQKLDDTSNALAEFSRFGLRTLVVAYREISESEYHTFNKAYTEAELALEGRDEKINVVAETVECNLRILGCTAVEDKLQEDLPATIESILQAEINLWLLTGDKTETAINIGLSSNLISKEMELFVLDAEEEMEIIKSKMKENQNVF